MCCPSLPAGQQHLRGAQRGRARQGTFGADRRDFARTAGEVVNSERPHRVARPRSSAPARQRLARAVVSRRSTRSSAPAGCWHPRCRISSTLPARPPQPAWRMSLMISRIRMSRCGVYVSERPVLATSVAPDLHEPRGNAGTAHRALPGRSAAGRRRSFASGARGPALAAPSSPRPLRLLQPCPHSSRRLGTFGMTFRRRAAPSSFSRLRLATVTIADCCCRDSKSAAGHRRPEAEQ